MVSYDRLLTDSDIDYYVSFDSETVGKQQGESLSKKLAEGGDSPTIAMINGAPTDNNAKLFKKGAKSVFSAENVKIGKEYDTPDWSPDKAQQEMEQAITALGDDGFQGVYAANDGTAGGAIAAMKSAGIDPADRPTTGQDAELAAIQRILAGEQFMTVYKPVIPLSDAAAKIAVALVRGEDPPSGLVNGETDNGKEKVPTVELETVVGYQGERQRHDRQGRVLEGFRDLRRQVRQCMQGGRNPVRGVIPRAGRRSAARLCALTERKGCDERQRGPAVPDGSREALRSGPGAGWRGLPRGRR